jgi:ribonuclease VapC
LGIVIVLDSSAMIAILQKEPDAERYYALIQATDACVVSAVTVFEAAIVMLRRRGPEGVKGLLEFLAELQTDIRPFTEPMISTAVQAYQQFGKGRGSRAQLNFGDCISYALAKSLGVPLLFKGDDFSATDVVACS